MKNPQRPSRATRFVLMGVLAAVAVGAIAPVFAAPLVDQETAASAFIPLTPVKPGKDNWLRSMQVSLAPAPGKVLTLKEMVNQLGAQGLIIVSEVDLKDRVYSGQPLKNVDGEVALRLMLAGTGMDYRVDEQRRLVTLRPVLTRTWYLPSNEESLWNSVRAEIESRMQILGHPAEAIPKSYQYSPATGAVTVLAPYWVHDDLDGLFQRMGQLADTEIVFQAELLAFQGTQVPGLGEISRLMQEKYGYSVTSNGLGGMTFRDPASNLDDPVTTITNFLAQRGMVQAMQRPTLSTVSGRKAEFKHGTADRGTVMQVLPRLDPVKGVFRTRIDLTHSGVASLNYSGDALLRSGDIVVLNGPLEDPDPQGQRRSSFLILRVSGATR